MSRKKWVPMPEHLLEELKERVQYQYKDLIAELPDLGMPNPVISTEATNDGFTADVKFYNGTGGYSSSLWEYKNRDHRW